MEKVEKKITFKDKIDIIKKDISRRRDKKSLKEGSIIYFGDRDKIGICLSKDEYVTINEDEINKKVVKEPIYHSIEYYVGSIGKESFGSENLKKIVESCIDESNIMGFKYKNSYEFASKKVNEDIKKKSISKDLLSLKEKLKSDYKIDKWYSTFTSLSVKELEDKIEEKKKEKEKIKNNFNSEKENKIKTIENLEKYLEEISTETKDDIQVSENMEEIFDENLNVFNEFDGINIDKNKITILENINETSVEIFEQKNIKKIIADKKNELIELDKEFDEKNKKIENEINSFNKELEKEKENEKKECQSLTESLEKNLEKLNNELNDISEEELNDIRGGILELEKISQEISNEDIKNKSKIIGYINKLVNKKNEYEYILKHHSSLLRDFKFRPGELASFPNYFFEIYSNIKNNPTINNLIKIIGRKKEKEDKISEIIYKINEYGKDEILGVELGDDVMRVLPSELVYLSNEETEYIFFLKYLEKKLLCYSLVGEEHEEKENKIKIKETGPIIALLDTSGSMYDNYKRNLSRAILLNTYLIAKKEERNLYVILFGVKNESLEMKVNFKEPLDKFLKFIENGFWYDEDFEPPLRRAIDIIKNEEVYKYADVLLLTDGISYVTNKFNDYLMNEKKKINMRIFTILIKSYDVGTINKFSDKFIVVN